MFFFYVYDVIYDVFIVESENKSLARHKKTTDEKRSQLEIAGRACDNSKKLFDWSEDSESMTMLRRFTELVRKV